MTVKIPKTCLTLTLSSLLFGNAFQPILKSEDAYSPVMFALLWLPLVVIYFSSNLKIPRLSTFGFLLSIFVFSCLLGLVKILVESLSLQLFLTNMATQIGPKILFLAVSYIFVQRISEEEVESLFKNFLTLFLLSCALSIVAAFFIRQDRYVLYADGASFRFAAFHYELVNFVFSAAICVFVAMRDWRLSGKILCFVFLFVPIIYQISRSNFVPPLAACVVGTSILIAIRSQLLKKVMALGALGVAGALLLLLSQFGKSFDTLAFLFPRAGQNWSEDGSALYIRVYPMIKSMEYFTENFFSIPYGLGNAQLDPSLSSKLYQIAAGGITKVLADLLWLSIPVVALFTIVFLRALARVREGNRADQTAFLILCACFCYISFQPGFFNFTAWTAILCSLKQLRIFQRFDPVTAGSLSGTSVRE